MSVAPLPASAQCHLQKLFDENGSSLDRFGETVSISGPVVTVGPFGFVCRLNGTEWMLEADLDLGLWTTVDGDRIIGNGPTGIIESYRYQGGTWVPEGTLIWLEEGEPILFTGPVSFLGDVAIVGHPLADDACPEDYHCNSGAAYVFRWDGVEWIAEQKLTASDISPGAGYGMSVAMDDGRAVIGAPTDTYGKAYVVEWDGVSWVEQQTRASAHR
jgi:hypothetical protein